MRVIGALFGIGSVVFVVLLGPAILAQEASDVPLWWTATALVGVLVLPIAMTATALTLPLPAVRAMAAVTALLYLGALITLPLVQEARVGANDAAPWVLGLTAVGTTAAAIAWRPRPAWGYLIAVTLLVALDRVWTAAVPLTEIALQDAAYAGFFCAVFCSLAIGARRAGRAVDMAAAEAVRAAADTAARRARDRERDRVDALVHDEVLATLLLASRTTGPLDEAVHVAAGRALDRLESLTVEPRSAAPVALGDLVSQLRAATTDAAPDARFLVDGSRGPSSLPARIAESFLAATAEALRNAVRHAGPDANISVHVGETDAAVVVTIKDDGAGFDPASVPSNRLGLGGSVSGRMRSAGGVASIRSAPGSGTEVRLQWPDL